METKKPIRLRPLLVPPKVENLESAAPSVVGCVILSRLLIRNVTLCFKELIGLTGCEGTALEKKPQSRKQHFKLQPALVFMTVSASP